MQFAGSKILIILKAVPKVDCKNAICNFKEIKLWGKKFRILKIIRIIDGFSKCCCSTEYHINSEVYQTNFKETVNIRPNNLNVSDMPLKNFHIRGFDLFCLKYHYSIFNETTL